MRLVFLAGLPVFPLPVLSEAAPLETWSAALLLSPLELIFVAWEPPAEGLPLVTVASMWFVSSMKRRYFVKWRAIFRFSVVKKLRYRLGDGDGDGPRVLKFVDLSESFEQIGTHRLAGLNIMYLLVTMRK